MRDASYSANICLALAAGVLCSSCVLDSSEVDEGVRASEQAIYEVDHNDDVLSHLIQEFEFPDLEHRFVVAVQNATGGRCTGTLVGQRRVVTAAHCLPSCDPLGERVDVAAGRDAGWLLRTTNAAQFSASIISIPGTAYCSPWAGTENDGWTSTTEGNPGVNGANDVAVIHLDSSVGVGVVNPAAYPTPRLGSAAHMGLPRFTKTAFNSAAGQISVSDYNGTNTIYGFGFQCWQDDEPCTTGFLRTAETLTYHRLDPCFRNEPNCTDEGVFATLERYGVGIGRGDSGGPLLRRIDGVQWLIGVASAYHRPIAGNRHFIHATLAENGEKARWMRDMLGGEFGSASLLPVASIESIGLFAEESLTINDRGNASASSGDRFVVGAGEVINLGVASLVDADLTGTEVLSLANAAHVSGEARAFSYPRLSAAHVPEFIGTLPTLPSLGGFRGCLAAIPFTSIPHVSLEPDQGPMSHSLTPGYYGWVTVKRGRRLILDGPGDYFLSGLDIDSQGTLEVRGGARIFVANGVRLIGNFVSDNDETLILSRSSSDIFVDGDGFNVHIVAPDAEVILNSGRALSGGIRARKITLHQDSSFEYREHAGADGWCDY